VAPLDLHCAPSDAALAFEMFVKVVALRRMNIPLVVFTQRKTTFKTGLAMRPSRLVDAHRDAILGDITRVWIVEVAS
jgi:hypothetical protein